ncbi:precorrin-6Y C5,15-methyltransferase (decarboxylating) subunit CbiT [Candidatus Viridilinea mediisalina]|uniref:tRNA (guanine(46)-N(7))-methyltransferase n=2 Tax=Candidatus Viridilinea mediisalina TaxID=2024553 RepID=A0A2A6REL2_9CHLR|nr:precorrin-6Y C5,15-methyltransferase (decarboxylating) subunit CbiT [Candidatus Viridilinea mediisalina]
MQRRKGAKLRKYTDIPRLAKRRRTVIIGRPWFMMHRHSSLVTHIAPHPRIPASPHPRIPASPPIPPGLPDAAFSTTGGLITKREVRLLSLMELALGPGEVLWDIGAGSGAVGIEAARWQPKAHVYAIERRAELCGHIRTNIDRFMVQNISLIEGSAPQACADLPDPHAIFIGGSGGQIEPIIGLACQRLRPHGRLVIALVSLEHLVVARNLLPSARIVQVQVNLGVPIVGMLRLEAQNPIFVLTWKR